MHGLRHLNALHNTTLTGKTALVVGATTPSGWAVVQALGHAGARLMLAGSDADALEHAMQELQAQGVDTRWTLVHSLRTEDVLRVGSETLHRMGDVDVLVNHVPDDERSALSIQAFWSLAEHVVRHSMQGRHSGCIVNLSGWPLASSPVEAAAVAGRVESVRHLTTAMARQWGSEGVRANALCIQGAVQAMGTLELGLQQAVGLLCGEAGRCFNGECWHLQAGEWTNVASAPGRGLAH